MYFWTSHFFYLQSHLDSRKHLGIQPYTEKETVPICGLPDTKPIYFDFSNVKRKMAKITGSDNVSNDEDAKELAPVDAGVSV